MPLRTSRGARRVLTVCAVACAALGVVSRAHADCSKDTDCKGDRICERGQCVSPGAATASPVATPQAATPPPKPAPPPKPEPPPKPAPPPLKPKSPAVEAAELVSAGNAAIAQKKLPEACDLFEKSYEVRPQPSTLASLARCREKAGQTPAAIEAWRKLEATGGPAYKNQAKTALKALAPQSSPPPPPAAPAKSGPAAPAAAPAVTAVKSVGGATWSDGVGFVLTGPAPAASATPWTPPPVPVGLEHSLSRVSWGLDAGLAIYVPTTVKSSVTALAPRLDFTIRAEFRRQSSWLAPWFDVPSTIVFVPDSASPVRSILNTAPHVGIDVHPARLPNLGVGPFIGYRVGLMLGGGGSPTIENGVDLSPLHVHFRTREVDGAPPTFDLATYFVEKLSGPFHAEYVGLRMGVGGHTRFRVVAEARLNVDGTKSPGAQAFETVVASFPQAFFVGVGVGSAA